MKIKRTTAPDMRTAMKIIRDEQGPDAVILGNRKVAGGIEIVSAVDYEPGAVDSASLFADPEPPAAPAPALAAAPAPAAEAVAAPPAPPPRRAPAAVEASAQRRWDAHNKRDLDDAERSVRRATELLRAARAADRQASRGERAPTPEPAEDGDYRAVARAAAQAADPPARAIVDEESLRQLDEHRLEPPAPRRAARAPEPRVEPTFDTAFESTFEPEAVATPTAPAPAGDQMAAMQAELQAMRKLMSQQLDVMGWGNMTRRQPARVNLLTRLHHMGIGTELALELCESVDSATDPSRNWRDALARLQAQIPVSRDDMVEHGGVFALVGTTGAGKTTTIAKLAAQCALRHGKQSVALISADNRRVGAREQLRSFAAILDVPLVFSESDEQLEREVQRLRDRRLVLIDTAGLGCNDPRLGPSLAQLRRVKAIQPVVVLAANTERGALEQSCKAFAHCDPVAAIVTKVDEAHALGAVITALVEQRLPLGWLGTGQRVPEDLAAGSAAGLMRLALGTEALRKSSLLDADELASVYGSAGALAHA